MISEIKVMNFYTKDKLSDIVRGEISHLKGVADTTFTRAVDRGEAGALEAYQQAVKAADNLYTKNTAEIKSRDSEIYNLLFEAPLMPVKGNMKYSKEAAYNKEVESICENAEKALTKLVLDIVGSVDVNSYTKALQVEVELSKHSERLAEGYKAQKEILDIRLKGLDIKYDNMFTVALKAEEDRQTKVREAELTKVRKEREVKKLKLETSLAETRSEIFTGIFFVVVIAATVILGVKG